MGVVVHYGQLKPPQLIPLTINPFELKYYGKINLYYTLFNRSNIYYT